MLLNCISTSLNFNSICFAVQNVRFICKVHLYQNNQSKNSGKLLQALQENQQKQILFNLSIFNLQFRSDIRDPDDIGKNSCSCNRRTGSVTFNNHRELVIPLCIKHDKVIRPLKISKRMSA